MTLTTWYNKKLVIFISFMIATCLPCPSLQCRISTYVWLILVYPVLAVIHLLACVLAWLPVFTIPVAKMNARVLTTILLMAPEDIQIHRLEKVPSHLLICHWVDVEKVVQARNMCSIFLPI